MKKKWTEAEDKILKAGWQIVATAELAKNLNRPIKGVRRRAQRLKLPDGRVKWSENQLEVLTSNWGSISAVEIAQLLHRDVRTVYQRAFGLKLGRGQRTVSSAALTDGQRRGALAHRTGRIVSCANCGKKFYRTRAKIKDQNFCCHACRGAILKPSEASIRKALLANKLKPNKLEVFLNSLLEIYFPNEFLFNGDLSQGVMLGGLIPDFINVNGKKQVIELFGDYWHDKKKDIPWKATEFGRQAVFSQLGFKLLVIWEHELKSPDEVVEKIKEFNK